MSAQRFKPYPTYRDSKVEWLGKIPEGWQVKRLKTFAAPQLSNVDKKSSEGQERVLLCNYTDVYYNERITPDLDFMRATATPEQVRRFELSGGDVLITKDSESWTDIAVPAVVAEDLPGVLCGYHLALIRPGLQCHGPFLARAFRAVGPRDQLQLAANGITRFGLGGGAIATSAFAMPPMREQRAIAAFLDPETARIDALVEKKERLIELLREQRSALITRAVTKGLDPTVPMKDSGVMWLGEIPEHWEIRRLRELTPGLGVGVVVQPSQYVSDDGLPFLYGRDIQEGKILAEQARRISREDSQRLPKSQLHLDDLVMVRVGAPGVTAAITSELEGANCASLIIIRRHSSFLSNWLCYLLNSRLIRFQVDLVQYGAAQEQFNVGHAVNFLVPTPPMCEQRAITQFLDRETARIDELVAKVREAIDRLKEYRIALISAAVTGKIDVREAS